MVRLAGAHPQGLPISESSKVDPGVGLEKGQSLYKGKGAVALFWPF